MKVFRTFDLVLIAVLLATVGWTFKVKHDSQLALDRVRELEKKIAAEKTEIDLLKSDWSLLTNPARLQELVEKYGDQLNLAPLEPEQIATEEALPAYKQQLKQHDSPMFDDFVAADKSTKTGSISKDTGQAAQ